MGVREQGGRGVEMGLGGWGRQQVSEEYVLGVENLS